MTVRVRSYGSQSRACRAKVARRRARVGCPRACLVVSARAVHRFACMRLIFCVVTLCIGLGSATVGAVMGEGASLRVLPPTAQEEAFACEVARCAWGRLGEPEAWGPRSSALRERIEKAPIRRGVVLEASVIRMRLMAQEAFGSSADRSAVSFVVEGAAYETLGLARASD